MLFSIRLLLTVSFTLLLLLPLAGCGEKSAVGQSSTKLEQSQSCIDCHQDYVNPVTGKVIVEEWKLSHHNTSNAAGCADCHDPEPGHPAENCNLCHGGTPAGSSPHVSTNPDRDGKCNKCHGSTSGLFPSGARRAHFGNLNVDAAFTRYTASYVSTNYKGNCRKCHNPHDPTSNIEYNRAWATSGHGLTTENSRLNGDYKLNGTSLPANLVKGESYCVRCHTTTGFINFVPPNSNFLNVQPFGLGDKTKEVTGCDACHTDYSFKVRAIPRVTIFFNFSGVPSASSPGGHVKIQNNGVTFPDLGSSNVCVPCHSGRGNGSLIALARDNSVDFTKSGSVTSTHNLNAAAVLTAKSTKTGYEFSNDSGVLREYILGVGAATGHDTFGLSSGKGPCISCHMNKTIKSDSHVFSPVLFGSVFPLYTSNRTWSQVYSINSTNMPLGTLTIASVTSQSCNTSGCHVSLGATELTQDKEGYISALAVLNKWIRLVRYVPANPQLAFNATSNKARSTTKWDYLGAGTGPDLMGAAFNLSMLNTEPGAYTHNPLYAKRLVFDSIYFLCTKATDPALGTNQYPTTAFNNVADAITFLTTATISTARTLETVSVNGVNVSNVEVAATITSHQATAAITWLYGTATPSDKFKRPGD